MLEQRAFAAAGAAENAENLAALNLEIQVFEDDFIAVADGQVPDFDFRPPFFFP